jgi:hypothetical protein
MAHVFPEGRVKETATVTGTNPYSIVGPAGSTFLGFSSEVGNGNTVDYVAINAAATTYELGRGTVTVGTPTTLSRTTIYKSTNAHAIVNWPASTTVTLFAVLRGGVVKFGEHDLNGDKLIISADGTTHLEESNSVANQTVLTIAGSLAARMELTGGIPIFNWISTDSGAAAGPFMRVSRDSSTPAVNDLLGEVQFGGRNSAAASITYAGLRGAITSPTTASESGTLTVRIRSSGSDIEVSRWGVDSLLVGKVAPDININGVELRTDGRMAITRTDTADGSAIIAMNTINAGDNNYIRFFSANTNIGQIRSFAGDIVYQTFTGSHWADWATGYRPEEPVPPGTVLVSVDEFFDQKNHPQLCRVAVCHERASPRIYGVTLHGERPDTASLGTARVRAVGRVRGGDLLQASEIPGIAECQPDDIVRSSTIGKVTIGDLATDERLVPIVVYCG